MMEGPVVFRGSNDRRMVQKVVKASVNVAQLRAYGFFNYILQWCKNRFLTASVDVVGGVKFTEAVRVHGGKFLTRQAKSVCMQIGLVSGNRNQKIC